MSAAVSVAPARASTRSVAAARVGLVLVGLAQLEVAVWGLVAPHAFFTGFPGAGHRWVAALGPYNEHLLRDYAASELGLAVLMIGAAIWFSRRVVLLAGAAFLAATLPHFAYHVTTTSSFSTEDNIGSLGAFLLEVGLVTIAMWIAGRSSDPANETSGS
jgi:hypothetical protein